MKPPMVLVVVAFAAMRLVGCASPAFQAFAHLLVGFLAAMWLQASSPIYAIGGRGTVALWLASRDWFYGIAVMVLVAVELWAFFTMR